MDKINEFIDIFRSNLIVEFNKNILLKERLVPFRKTYHVLCTGDRVICYYLNKIKFYPKSSYVPPGHKKSLKSTEFLPSSYKFSLSNLVLNSYFFLKNIFFNKQSSFKFFVEDELIPNLFDQRNFTEEGFKDLKLLQMEYKENDLKDIRRIEYLGNKEFLFEAIFKEPLMIKIRVIEDCEGIKIESLTYSNDL